MKIIYERPPNYQDIIAIFPTAKKAGVLFTYGDVIYSPTKQLIPKSLIAHEEVHSARQLKWSSIELWWNSYLTNKAFRYEEELLAHQAEYQAIIGNRKFRKYQYKQIAKRLSSPLYGSMVSYDKALHSISANVTTPS